LCFRFNEMSDCSTFPLHWNNRYDAAAPRGARTKVPL
jgi:hypothetical protein